MKMLSNSKAKKKYLYKYYSQHQIKLYCLDKKKVKDAIDNRIKKIELFDVNIEDKNRALNLLYDIKKELYLDKVRA